MKKIILLLFLLFSSFVSVESAELNDKDTSVLKKVFFGIGLNVIDANCLEKKYLSLTSKILPTSSEIRAFSRIITEERFQKIERKLLDIFIKFQYNLFISKEEYIPILTFLYELKEINFFH